MSNIRMKQSAPLSGGRASSGALRSGTLFSGTSLSGARSSRSPQIQIRSSATTAQPTTRPKTLDSVAPLFQPLKLGPLFNLEHRMVYPPLTRCRSIDNVPNSALMAEYYAQRSTKGGLVISEGTVVAANGHGYPATPGIYTQQQIDAWKPIVEAAHAKGAVFFCQLWHVGRASHAAFSNGGHIVSASAIAAKGEVWTGTAMELHPVPEALDLEGIKAHVQAYVQGAKNARAAGFDGVEIHGANGYLIDQFTKSGSNVRQDAYGGCIENRCRFALEVVDAVVAELGRERVGIRLSPFTNFNDCTDATPYATFAYLIEQLNKRGLVYLHMVEGRVDGVESREWKDTLLPFRKIWKGTFIAAGGFTAESGARAVADGDADLVAYGRTWIANPDLPTRFQLGAPLTPYNRDTFYTQGKEGFTDYPFLSEN